MAELRVGGITVEGASSRDEALEEVTKRYAGWQPIAAKKTRDDQRWLVTAVKTAGDDEDDPVSDSPMDDVDEDAEITDEVPDPFDEEPVAEKTGDVFARLDDLVQQITDLAAELKDQYGDSMDEELPDELPTDLSEALDAPEDKLMDDDDGHKAPMPFARVLERPKAGLSLAKATADLEKHLRTNPGLKGYRVARVEETGSLYKAHLVKK
jgi:hypothetical protein